MGNNNWVKFDSLINDVNIMLQKGEIQPNAADWLIKALQQLLPICDAIDADYNREIADKLDSLINDVNIMLQKGEIQPNAADWLIKSFQNLYGSYDALTRHTK